MDTLFFWLSKLLWFLVAPDCVLLALVLLAWGCLVRGAVQWARRILGFVAVLLLVMYALPVGEWVLYPLESRFPANPELPARIDGIVVLGGGEDTARAMAWDQAEVNDSADRFIASAALALRHPEAKLLFASGSGSVLDQGAKGADAGRRVYSDLGIAGERILLERESRNTAENATLGKAVAKPSAAETWVLVTSASHMPRAVGVFCKAAWPVIPYPVDHHTTPGNLVRYYGDLGGNLADLSSGVKEWVGLTAYYLTGRTSALFPSGCGDPVRRNFPRP